MTDEKANGHLVGLSQKPKSWDDFFASPVRITDDFMAECEQPKDQEREANDDFAKEHPDLLDDGPGLRVPKIRNTVISKRSWYLCSCGEPLVGVAKAA